MAIKGVIFDYGGTIDSRGVHWSEIIWDGWKLAGATFDKDAFRKAYVATERHFATHPVVRPDFDFRQLMQAKTSTEADFPKPTAMRPTATWRYQPHPTATTAHTNASEKPVR